MESVTNIENKVKLSKPIYFRMGFHSIKGVLMFFLLTEGWTILIASLVEEFRWIIPSRIAMFSMLFGLYILLKLIDIFYHDLTNDKISSPFLLTSVSHDKPFVNLFKLDEAINWINMVKKTIYNRRTNLNLFIVGIVVALGFPVIEYIQMGYVTLGGHTLTNFWGYLLLGIFIIKNIILTTIDISLFYLIISLLNGISKIGMKNDKLALNELGNVLSLSSVDKEHKLISSGFEQVYKSSLFLFKQNCKPIATMMTKFSVLILLAVLGGLTYFYIFVLIAFDSQYAVILFLVIIVLTPILVILTFILPQMNLHQLLKTKKEQFLGDLWKIHEYQKNIFLRHIKDEILNENADANNDSIDQLQMEKMKIIDKLIHDTDSLLTWPFNYKQIGSLTIASLSMLSPFLIDLIKREIFDTVL